MKKNISICNRIFGELFSGALLFLIMLSLTLNPVAATVTNAMEARQATVTDNSFVNPAAPLAETSILAPTVAFTNPAAINIPDNPGVPALYPSPITTSGLVGTISTVTVTLNNLTFPRTRDIDLLLVGPGGQKFEFMSDVGGVISASNNVTVTFDDAAAANLTQTGPLVNGASYKPTDFDGVESDFPSPAPAGPYNRPAPVGAATFNSVYGGLSGASANGVWNLYAIDDAGGGGASVINGWTLNITTAAAAAATTTALTSSANPSFRQNAVTFTATVTSTSTVNSGTVTFVDTTTGTTLCNAVPVNGSGVAQCVAAANTLSEGNHTITATYNGNATFATSNASLTQVVNNQTVITGNTFTNPGTITIADNLGGSTVPYPSNIFVTGLSGTISKVTLKLTNFNATRTGDVDFLLVGPGGQTYVFVSDVGGTLSATANATITLDDAAATQLPNSGSLVSGTFRPTDYSLNSDSFPAPAPVGPYNMAPPAGVSTFASVFGGAAPNGTWSLYATDDAGGGGNSTVGSWSLTVTTSGDAATTTVLTSTPNPSNINQAVTFTATVMSAVAPVTVGTVTFRRGATILCANVPLNGSGQATCTPPANTFNTEGDFVITADYNGSAGQFNISNGSITQQVNSPTVVTCLNFANNGGITVSNTTAIGNPYPSDINVSGLAGTISKVTLTLGGLNAPTPDHVDFLLVGPLGQKFLFMGDAGGTTDIVNQTITLDDAAATALPDSTAITSGTYRPASYTGDSDTFPAPAPAAPYNPAAPEGTGTFANVFNGAVPNGKWSLYIVEDAGDTLDTTLANWSLTFTLAPAVTTTAIASSANPSVFGQSVTLTATVTATGGTPTGNVQFFDGATPIGAAVALNGSGQATVTTSALSVGTHTITAQYAGASAACTGTFNASGGSLTGGQVVNKANTTVTVGTSANPANANSNVTLTVTVAALAPGAGTRTGTVTFLRNGVAIPGCIGVAINASGQAICVTTFAPAGSYNVTAQYSGDGNFNAGNNTAAPLVQQIRSPTAASVSIGGRIVTTAGRGIAGVRVAMTDSGGQTRYTTSNPFGYYRFTDVAAGNTYIFEVSAKGYRTATTVREVTEELADFNITLQR